MGTVNFINPNNMIIIICQSTRLNVIIRIHIRVCICTVHHRIVIIRICSGASRGIIVVVVYCTTINVIIRIHIGIGIRRGRSRSVCVQIRIRIIRSRSRS